MRQTLSCILKTPFTCGNKSVRKAKNRDLQRQQDNKRCRATMNSWTRANYTPTEWKLWCRQDTVRCNPSRLRNARSTTNSAQKRPSWVINWDEYVIGLSKSENTVLKNVKAYITLTCKTELMARVSHLYIETLINICRKKEWPTSQLGSHVLLIINNNLLQNHKCLLAQKQTSENLKFCYATLNWGINIP